MTSLTTSKGAEIEKLVFIDSTWLQAKHIFKDPRLKGKVVSTHSLKTKKK